MRIQAPLLTAVALLQCLATPLGSSVEETDEEAVADFTEWLGANGVNTSSWEVLPTGDGRGRGLFATKPIVAGQVIVSVPISLTFGVQAALGHERIGPLLRGTLSRAPDGFHEDCIATSALLLDAHVKGAASHWAPYLAMLPPVGQAGASPCDGFEARGDFGSMPSGMRILCADYEHTMNGLFEELDGGLLEPLLGPKYGTKDERRAVWKWAIGVSWSRGQGKVFNASSHGCFLVPALDSMNHGDATAVAPVATQLFGAEPYAGTTGVVARRSYSAGEELRVAYFGSQDGGGPEGGGSRCQQSIYLQYGFVLPGERERDCLPMVVPRRDAHGKLLGVPGAGSEGDGNDGGGDGHSASEAELPTFVVGKDGAPPARMLDALRTSLGVAPSAAQLAEIKKEEAAAAQAAEAMTGDGGTQQAAEAAAAALIAARRVVNFDAEKPVVLCAFDELLQMVERDHAKCAATPNSGVGDGGAGAGVVGSAAAVNPMGALDVLREAEARVLKKARRLVGASLVSRSIDCLQVEAPFAGGDDVEIEVTDLD